MNLTRKIKVTRRRNEKIKVGEIKKTGIRVKRGPGVKEIKRKII